MSPPSAARRCSSVLTWSRTPLPPAGFRLRRFLVRRVVVVLVLEGEDGVGEARAQLPLGGQREPVVPHEDLQAFDPGQRRGQRDSAVRVDGQLTQVRQVADEGRQLAYVVVVERELLQTAERRYLPRHRLDAVPPQVELFQPLKLRERVGQGLARGVARGLC